MTEVYIAALIKSYPNVREVWLIGSRADGSATKSSDWDYIVVADQFTLDDLSRNTTIRNLSIDLLIVYDGNEFRKPWRDGDREKHGSLSGWHWKRISQSEAIYQATKPRDGDDFNSWVKEGKARRVYPA